MLLGSGLGLTMVSPWSNESASVTTFAVSTAIWLVIVQWLSSGLGGYLTGRLRTKWVGIHMDETFFRDTAHGFMAWALATLLVVFVLGSALSAAIGTGVKAASTVASRAAMGASAGGDRKRRERRRQRRGVVFRRCAVPSERSFQAGGAGRGGRCDSSRTSLPHPHYESGGRRVSADDKTYLGQLVAARTGLSQADATARVDAVLAQVEAAKVQAQEAADTARKAGASFALVGALSLMIGAFIASAAAALGGKQRDDEEDALHLTASRS